MMVDLLNGFLQVLLLFLLLLLLLLLLPKTFNFDSVSSSLENEQDLGIFGKFFR